MTKKEVRKRVLYNGKKISKKDFTWDEKTRTFSSDLDGLVIDFNGINGVTFRAGYDCTFKTSSDCTFITGSVCTFDTSHNCTFDTGFGCTFKTSYDCVIVRRDIYEVIELKEDVKIKLNTYEIKGYKVIEDVAI